MERLDAVLDRRLGVVCAPAGYGKSTAVSQWCEALSGRSFDVRWVALDEDDADVYSFLSYLLAAILDYRRSEDLLSSKFPASLGEKLADRVTALIVSELERRERPTVLVLDDFHCAQTAKTVRVINRLIAAMPDNTHVVIVARDVSQLGVVSRKVDQDLALINSSHLRFSLSEVGAFFAEAQDPPPPTSDLETLWEKTEGWPLALQAARMWLLEGGNPVELISTFSGRMSDISDYLNEQVMLGLPAPERQFLMDMAVLGEFDGDVANAVCERSDSWDVLEDIRRRNLFVVPQDTDGRTYRYHRLFSDFLIERLARQDRDRIEFIHLRAATWYAKRNRLRRATYHAIRADRPEVAAELVEAAGGWRLVLTGKISILRYLLARLAKDIIANHPRLLLADAYLSAKEGKIDLARQLLGQWDTSSFELSDHRAIFVAERLVIGKLVSGYTDAPETTQSLSRLTRQISALETRDNIVLALLHNYLCKFYFDLCHFDAANAAAERSIQFFEAEGDRYASHILNLYRGQISLSTGELPTAYRELSAIYSRTGEEYGDDSDAKSISGLLFAEAAYERNEIELARTLIDESLPHTEHFDGWFDIYAAGYMTAALLSFHQHGITAALEIVDRARETALRRSIKKLYVLAQLQHVNLYLLDGQLDLATYLLEKLQQRLASGSLKTVADHPRVRHTEGLVSARLAVYRDENLTARRLLEPLIVQSKRIGWVRQSVKEKVVLVQSYASNATRLNEDGLSLLNESLLEAAHGGFIRSFLDEGENILKHLRLALANGVSLSENSARFAKRILAEQVHHAGRSWQDGEGAGDRLTPRELEIMILIGDGFANKQIAYDLGISESTVKFHKRNIYRKLEVSSRSAVLAKARELHIL